MRYADLMRSLSGYNGMSEKGRTIQVRYHDDNHITFSESADTLTITVPSMHDRQIPGDQAHKIRASLASVVSQFLYSEGIHSTVDEWKCQDSPLGAVVKETDSLRANSTLSSIMKGVGNDLRAASETDLREFSSQIKRVGKLSEEGERTAAALAATKAASALANNVGDSVLKNFSDSLPPGVADRLEGAVDRGLLTNAVTAKTLDESIEAGKKLFEYFFDKSAEEEIEQQQQQNGSGSGKEDSQDGGAGSKEVMEATGHDSEGESETGEEEGSEFCIGQDGSGQYYITPPDEVRDIDYVNNKRMRQREVEKEVVLKNNGALFAKVRRLLQVRSESQYIGAQKRGKLQRSKVYRVGCPTVGNGDWNSRIWRKRVDSDTLDTSVELLVDFSGSMHGPKMDLAIEATVKLTDCLDRVGIPVSVVGFSDTATGYTNGVLCSGHFKQFDQPCNAQDMLDSMYHMATHHMHANPDACAVHYALERLAQRREKRRVLLVLSDGHPASSRRGQQAPVLKDLVNVEAEKLGVECYGVGIMSNSVQEFYKENAVLRRANELPSCLAEIIKAKIV